MHSKPFNNREIDQIENFLHNETCMGECTRIRFFTQKSNNGYYELSILDSTPHTIERHTSTYLVRCFFDDHGLKNEEKVC